MLTISEDESSRTMRQRNNHTRKQPLLLLLLLLLLCPVFGWVPPRPGSDLEQTYEPIHAYRRRLNLSYNYHPKLLHPETCRYLTEQECQDADESMQRHAHRHQQIQRRLAAQRQQQQRHLAVAAVEEEEEETRDAATAANDETRGERPTTSLRAGAQAESSSGSAIMGATSSGSTTDADTKIDLSTLDDEELQYHMGVFQEALSEFTQAYSDLKHHPTREEELEELNQLLAERNQTLEQARRQLDESAPRTEPAANTGRNPRVGSFTVLVLLMKFSDHKNRRVPKKYEYQILWNLRIRKWLQANSYGKYDAWFEVLDWKTTDNTEKFYSFGQSGRVAQFQESYWPLLNALDKDPNWDWRRFDVDDNGLLDGLVRPINLSIV
jgi:hypothetical protein